MKSRHIDSRAEDIMNETGVERSVPIDLSIDQSRAQKRFSKFFIIDLVVKSNLVIFV